MTAQTFKLDYPVSVEGQPTLDELTLRRPKVRDIRALQKGKGDEADRSLAMIADLAQISPAQLDELDPTDLAKINAWLEPILDPQG